MRIDAHLHLDIYGEEAAAAVTEIEEGIGHSSCFLARPRGPFRG